LSGDRDGCINKSIFATHSTHLHVIAGWLPTFTEVDWNSLLVR
jgi:hypothetical protein